MRWPAIVFNGPVNLVFQELTVLVSCSNGHIVEVVVPTSRPAYTKESFLLKLESRVIKTKSNKSEINRDPHKGGVECTENDKTREKSNVIEEINPSTVIDENIMYFKDSNEHCDPSKRYVSPSPSPAVLFAIYTPSEKTLWTSVVNGRDTNCLYEYDFETSEPINMITIPSKNGIALTAIETL